LPSSIVTERKRKRIFERPAILIYLIAISLLCWVIGYEVSLGYPIEEELGGTPLWNRFCHLLPGKLFTYIIGLVLLVGGGYLLQRANYALVLIREKTSLPFFLFILLLSSNPNFFPLKATSIAVFCMILAIYQLFTSYHEPLSMVKAFKASFIIAIGSLLWIHILWFLPLFWFGMYLFRCLSSRSFIASLLGVLTVYWFVLGWAVWQGDYTVFTIPAASLVNFSIAHFRLDSWLDWCSLIFTILLTILASVNILTYEHEDSLRSRQFLSFLMLFAMWALGLFFLYEHSSEEFIHVAVVASATLIAHFFVARRNRFTFYLFLFTIVFYPFLLFVQLWNF